MKKILYVTFLFILFFTVFKIADTFGLLESSGLGKTDPPIGKWEITLNGIDIKEEREITASDLIYEENNNVEPGYFAPGVTAGYEIVINPNNTDVSIRYDITADMSDIANHPNISFEVAGDAVRRVIDGEVIYSGVIPLSSIKSGETTTISTNLVWTNDEENNELDNELNNIDQSFGIIITIRFSQYLGEEL